MRKSQWLLGIRDLEIIEVILGKEAEVIEEYLDDKYSPSCLIYGTTLKGRILHVQSNYQGVGMGSNLQYTAKYTVPLILVQPGSSVMLLILPVEGDQPGG